jgi:polysaccharide biosynthesis transport protein
MDPKNVTAEPREPQELPEEPGLSLAEYLEILKRRRWLLIVPAVVLFVIVFVVTMILPTKYQSMAMIMIEQPEIATDLVRTTVTGLAEQRVQVVGQRVLNRENLRQVIEKFDLYAEHRDTISLDDLVRTMRSHIVLEMAAGKARGSRVPANAIAFTLAYESASPAQAQQVVEELANLFLQENTLQRQQAARETTRFLGQEGSRLSRDIAELEGRLAAFKEANRNSLPEMQNMNMNLMQRTEEELRRNDQDVRALNERISSLQSQLAEMNPSRHLERLRALEAEYASLAARFTERHPDRINTRRELESLRSELGGTGVVGPGNNPAYDQVQSQLQSALTDRRLQLAAREELRQKLNEIESRLSLTPLIEVEYRSLTREHDTAIEKLRDLQAKQMQAELAESLEAESKSERFVLIQSASLPYRPSSPNRPVLMFLGLVFSIGGGLGAVVVRESLDTAVHGPKGVARVTGVPPIAMIPYIQTDADRASIRQRQFLLVLGTITLLAGALALVHYQIQPLDELYLQVREQVGFETTAHEATEPEGNVE